ncbi:MAG: NAD-dependent malic enzyme [Vicinamibacteria bacterium]
MALKQYRIIKSDAGKRIEVPYRGARLLQEPMFNKGTAFSEDERRTFGLSGLLPSVVSTMDQQEDRAYKNIEKKADPLEKYIGLVALQDRNEHLYYRVLLNHLEEMLPIVYTPTVGLACQEYSRIFRRARGLWITPAHRGSIHDVLGHAPFDDVRLIVVTDNERILGLGDQGAGGMGIPVGKLALYTAAAGIHPSRTLPISLDVGTDNQALLDDPLYIGYRQKRLRGAEYASLVEEFVNAVKVRFPRALLQWEDFKKVTAFQLLERYQKTLPSFNDDIQGTAAVAVAGMMAGVRVSGIPLKDQRAVILGAGAAGVGIARLIRTALITAGMPATEARERIAVLDSRGLVVDDGPLDEHKKEFAWSAEMAAARGMAKGQARDLEAVVRTMKPTVLIGTSGEPGTFTEGVIRAMAAVVERPVIFPMSNPTSQTEAHPKDVLEWTDGRALVATGSPFDDVVRGSKTYRIAQGNNAFIFPGVGLGSLISQTREVTDEMFAAAALALAECVSEEDIAAGSLFPRGRELRRVASHVAAAVVRTARDAGLGRVIKDEDVAAKVKDAMWEPQYVPYDPAPSI